MKFGKELLYFNWIKSGQTFFNYVAGGSLLLIRMAYLARGGATYKNSGLWPLPRVFILLKITMIEFWSKESIEILIRNTPRFEWIKEWEQHECDCEHCDIWSESDDYSCEKCNREYYDFSSLEDVCKKYDKCVSCGHKFSDNKWKIKQLQHILKTRDLK